MTQPGAPAGAPSPPKPAPSVAASASSPPPRLAAGAEGQGGAGQDGAGQDGAGRGTPPPDLARLARGPAVWMLASGQMLGYACLYYVFAALILPWQADLGWDKTRFAVGPTLALLIAAALAPATGRLVDRGRGPEALALAPLLGAAGLGVLAQASDFGAYLFGWGIIGVACSIGLYEICFAFLIRRLGAEGRAAIVRVTLVAGFASTLAFPAGAFLAEAVGWRGALWCAALTLAGLGAPLHWFGARALRRQTAAPVAAAAAVDPGGAMAPALGRPVVGRARLRGLLRGRGFWLLAALFALVGLNHWMMIAFLLPVFVGLGAGPATAVLAASVVGPAQVVGRLLLMAGESRLGNAAASWLTVPGFVLGALVLALAGAAPGLIFAYAVIQGGAIGVMTILKPVLIADIMGREDYGAIAGAVQLPSLVVVALAPMIGAGMLEVGGIPGLIGLSLAMSLGSVVALAALLRRPGA